jgi:ABC-type multidrug transport system fused ATPase/permease subunit
MKILNDMNELLELAKPNKKTGFYLIIMTAFEVLLSLPNPILFAWILEKALNDLQIVDIAFFASCLLCLEISSASIRIIRVRYNRTLAVETANKLRDRFFTHLLHLPYNWYLENRSGGQSSSYLSDIDHIDKAVVGVVDRGLRSVFQIVFTAITFLIWNPFVATVALVIVPVTILLQRSLRKRVRDSSREKVNIRENMLSTLSEAVTHFQAVKAFVLEKHISSKINVLSTRYAETSEHLETRQAILRSTSSVMLLGVQYSFFVFGAILVIYKRLALPSFLGQMVLLGRLTGPLNTLMDYGSELTQCRAALHRVKATLNLDREDIDDKNKKQLSQLHKKGLSVRAKNLEFEFDSRLPLMKGWDFEIQAGQTVAIVGASGSGKSTLINLILGLHKNYRGELKINGIERSDLSQSSVRKRIAVVFQEQYLFNSSIRENLELALDEKSDDHILWDSLDKAHASDFVRECPQGLDTKVGVDGVKLSGGQRQRLAIAQALLRDPMLLLLDEATSALDSFSEAHIQSALAELKHTRTCIIVAHRLSTVRNADQILVVKDGSIAEIGDHLTLLSAGGIYSKLCEAQEEGILHWDKIESSDEK